MTKKTGNDLNVDRRAGWAVLLSGFLASLGIGLLSFAVPLISLDARVSGIWLGTGFAGFFLARLVAGPVGGWWADARSPRSPIVWGLGSGALVPLIYPAYPSLLSLFLIQFVLGFVSGLVRPAGLALLGGLPEKRDTWFLLHTFFFNLALFVGPLLGGLLYWNRAIEQVLIGVALCMVIAHLIAFAHVPGKHVLSQGDQPELSGEMGKETFQALLLAIFGRTFGIGLLVTFYPVLLTVRLDADGLVVGMLFSLIGLTTCIGLPLGAWLKRQSGHDPVTIGMLTSGAGLMGAGASVDPWHFVLAGMIMGFGAALSVPGAMSAVSASMRRQGRAFGATHVATGLGFTAGPLFGGLVVRASGDIGMAFFLAGLVGWTCLTAWAYSSRGPGRAFPHTVPIVLCIVGMVGAWFMARSERPQADGLYRYSDIAMGTVVNLTLETDSRKAAYDAARKALAFMRAMQADFDFRSPTGSVGTINRAAGKQWTTPSERVYALLERTLAFSRRSDGAFDPTIGAASTSPLYFALDESLLKARKNLVDYRLVRMRDGKVLLSKKGMALDLGGVAKGAIIDATVKMLRGLGMKAGIVEAGGDFYCFGDREWTIGIRHPRNDALYSTLRVRERGVCGSGDYEQFVVGEIDGEEKVRHHILNPSDMLPADETIGVTVLAPTAEMADRLATAVFVMGARAGRQFIKEHAPGAAVVWFNPDLSVITTPDFPQ